MGSLIRVLPGTYHDEPDLDVLVEEKQISGFFPASAALKQGIIQKANSCTVPTHSKETPTFRAGVVDPSTGRVDAWWVLERGERMESWRNYRRAAEVSYTWNMERHSIGPEN